ncbi:Glycoprotein membrane precursor gpi-anchored [Thalictrum thalictroides]|uniref:Glycoprotein membrane gpi-anchored n=1 Tax=Thalictrum thalictroides TaxID=46969 RepID=A0A7J6VWQ9_THATH|nr:Glycoprotein membrane precursor gpi-anchored [Thalictrum thalictroides]
MASSNLHSLLFVIFLTTMLLLTPQVQADEEDDLFRGINSYRASINISSLTENKNAECLAEQIADQFKKQPCTNDTGSNTILGTEPQFANFPDLLKKCHLNVTNTKDGVIMPACVPNLDQSIVLANFTKSQYVTYLNATKYTGVGIGSEHDWIVVILSTNTTDGSFVPASTDNSADASVPKLRLIYLFFSLFLGYFLVNLD